MINIKMSTKIRGQSVQVPSVVIRVGQVPQGHGSGQETMLENMSMCGSEYVLQCPLKWTVMADSV